MSQTIVLPRADGTCMPYTAGRRAPLSPCARRFGSRIAYRALAACAQGPDDYRRVYGDVLAHVREPVIIHWLGEEFDPALAGYWGYRDRDAAMDVCLAIIAEHAGKVDGIKISLLDAEREVRMRGRLPSGVRMYTGDDYNYAALIRGDAHS